MCWSVFSLSSLGQKYDGVAIDLWGMGCILLYILTAQLAFSADSQPELFSKIQKAEFTVPVSCSPEASDLVKKLLQVDGSKRLPIAMCWQQAWLDTKRFEFSQDFVKPQADRRQLIRELMGNSVVKSRQIVPGGGVEELQLIVLPITHIIYNADNVRIRDKVLTQFEIENTDTEKFDQQFYSKRENFETQKFIHSILSELAHDPNADIYTRLKQTQLQRDPILIDTNGVIVDGNRRMSSIRELYTESPSEFPEFNEIECVVIPRADRQNNKEYEVLQGLSHAEVLEKMSIAEGFVYLPLGGDTCPRVVIEAQLLGCKLEINDNVQHMTEIPFCENDILDIETYLYANRDLFSDFFPSSFGREVLSWPVCGIRCV